eukprot:SAG22_NODE_18737_length_282_cov_0.841530_1_plen_36_part_10
MHSLLPPDDDVLSFEDFALKMPAFQNRLVGDIEFFK